LFDHGTPRGIARALPEHTVLTAYAQGWDQLHNGALLQAAEDAAMDVVLTIDQGMRYQQNLVGRSIALVVLTRTTKWTRVRLSLDRISLAVQAAIPGSYTEVPMPFG
jgi:hypothetical protein